MVEPQGSIVRFDEASLGRHEPKTNRTGGKAREKTNRHLHGEVLLDNADAVIDALQAMSVESKPELPNAHVNEMNAPNAPEGSTPEAEATPAVAQFPAGEQKRC